MRQRGSHDELQLRTEELAASLDQAQRDNARLYTQLAREINETRLLTTLQRDYLERMRSLSRRLMVAEEDERRRLSREMHDRVGSNLSAMLLSLALMREELPAAAQGIVSRRLTDLESTLRATMDHVRDILGNLRPTALDELGLMPALRHHAAALSARTEVAFVVSGKLPGRRMAPDCEMAFFRIAQEACANVIKHAHARRVQISVTQDEGVLTMRIEDDGCGFDPAGRLPGSASLGLTIMRERADAIGAVFELDSRPGAGVRVQVVLFREARLHPAAP